MFTGMSSLRGTNVPIPFFQNMLPQANKKRILLVSYAFPPDSSMGARRWEKLLMFGSQRGWSMDVIMMHPSAAEMPEDSCLTSLPPGVRLFAVSFRESTKATIRQAVARVVGWVKRHKGVAGQPPRGNEFAVQDAPDGMRGVILALRGAEGEVRDHVAWKSWARRAAKVGIQLARTDRYDVVTSSGPPHMAHDAARRISRATGIPCVLDFRDPWVRDPAPREMRLGPLGRYLATRTEESCVGAASLIIANTPLAQRLFEESYPKLRNRFLTVMNGSDGKLASSCEASSTFIIAHVGWIYGGRDPSPLFRAVRRVIEDQRLTPKDIFVRFMGNPILEGRPITEVAADAGIADFFHSAGWQPRHAAEELMRHSTMVVLLQQGFIYAVPGKLFEYVQLNAWVLAIGDSHSALAQTLRGLDADFIADGDEVVIAKAIAARFLAFRSGDRPRPLNADGRFDRSHQAAILFDALERIRR